MNRRTRGIAPLVIASTLGASALLSGCATEPVTSCEQFEQSRSRMRYDTVYRYSAADTRVASKSFVPVRRSEPVTVRWYTLRVNRTQIRPCDHLYLTKDLYLRRTNDVSISLYEQREFYSADGQLIATKREDMTGQLETSGFYSASVPLPIPREAPPGAYRVVMRLLLKRPNAAERTIATASAEFRVHP